MRHGAKRKTCSHEGCTNQVHNEECVKGTERRGRLAVTRDVPTKLRKEEYALVMVPRSPKLAVTGDVPTKPDKAEYVEGMVSRTSCEVMVSNFVHTNYVQKGGVCKRHGFCIERLAVLKNLPIMLLREEFV